MQIEGLRGWHSESFVNNLIARGLFNVGMSSDLQESR